MLQQVDTAIAFVVVMLMLSLLVTAAVQAISALLDLRGKNLVRGLTDLFKQVDAGLREAAVNASLIEKIRNWLAHPFSRITLATKLADAITMHPTLAHTFTRAKAIRKDELLEVLRDFCSEAPAGKIDSAAQARLKNLLAAQLPGGADTAQAILGKLATQFPNLKEDLQKAVTEAVGKVSALEVGVEKWFDTVMDRASDIFTRWTRFFTVVISALLVVVLHIDAGLIFHQISSNAEIKVGLTKISDTALAQADETLKNDNRATAALKEVARKHKGDPVEGDLSNAASLITCADGKSWLDNYGKQKKPGVDMEQLEMEFVEVCQEQTVLALGKSQDQIGKIRHELASTELRIVPEQINGQSVFGDYNDSLWVRIKCWAAAYRSKRHLLGTLAMVVLLSLGAPFWFNALRQMSNLKPGISSKIEQEQSNA